MPAGDGGSGERQASRPGVPGRWSDRDNRPRPRCVSAHDSSPTAGRASSAATTRLYPQPLACPAFPFLHASVPSPPLARHPTIEPPGTHVSSVDAAKRRLWPLPLSTKPLRFPMAVIQPAPFRSVLARARSSEKFVNNRLANQLGCQAFRMIVAARLLAKRRRRLADMDEYGGKLLADGTVVIPHYLDPATFHALNEDQDRHPRHGTGGVGRCR